MSNHCVEVCCSGCGREWCTRCRTNNTGKSEERAKAAQKKIKKGTAYVVRDEHCCADQPVVMR